MFYSTNEIMCTRCSSYNVKEVSKASDVARGYNVYECQDCSQRFEIKHSLFRDYELDYELDKEYEIK